MPVAAHPGLYDPARPQPVLNGSRCSSCGRVYFPPVGIGCPDCGAAADRLTPTELAATGTLYSVATVHRHRGRDIEAPFAMGEIQLDAGPLIRCTMAVAEPELRIGQPVVARWVVQRTDDDGNQVVEPRFAPADSPDSSVIEDGDR
jgi:uncharacterized protein